MQNTNRYNVVVGLEVHNELKTKSKVFCSCAAEFSTSPNTNCCPVCTGMPGSLPVLNARAVEYTVRAGLALDCAVNAYAQFDRKNYYYPDLAKAYQISQLTHPLCVGGHLDIGAAGKEKTIRINRIHLEEDAGKLVHTPGGGTLVDYNRGGVPLIEIVTEPDLSGADEALEFLEKLKQVLKYIGISDCKMEEGSLRADVNVSLNLPGTPLGTRTEMKNIASFKAIHRAITYEVKRQQAALDAGQKIVQETRRWDDETGKSHTMRTKEDAQDYRYFPDPDLVPLDITADFVAKVKADLPMLPSARAAFYKDRYGLSEYDCSVLTADKEIADFFDGCVKTYDNPKMIANWIMTEVLRRVKEKSEGAAETKSDGEADIKLPLKPETFAKLLRLLAENQINQNAAKAVFEYYWEKESDTPPEVLVETMGLKQVSDVGELETVVRTIIDASPNAVADFKSGNAKALAFFVGQAMKATKGKANPALVNQIVQKLLS